ncbi:aldose 1-epimerase family protein [Cohnella rhizosphaerae]|uniref:Aldose 1-epimerase family protein n=1 Tax=Cohnella rhizosphaerae TaxID=1457232 RepID=A0A9X4L071_9BACL|nr:aldose 1-epimerase family protein [Cohnella rhizosphaerae]MDG0814130.1 aldose 1-epimerase family protein [Cohnella rhizosphaerae]
MRLYGKDWTRREIEARVGRMSQIGGVRRMTLSEGKEAGVELIRVTTGAGLTLDIVPSKGLDISRAELWGAPLSWQSAAGDAHPAYYDASGANWLRTASGGLLMTCGLTHAGSPSETPGGPQGLHGRAHHTPASQVSAREEWVGDEFVWSVEGTIEENALFGTNLMLRRRISGKLGDNSIRIEDCVENLGFAPAPHMMLYHFNFGFPLLDERTSLTLPPAISSERGGSGTAADCGGWERPDPNVGERVFYHELNDREGMAEACLRQPAFPAGPGTADLSVRLRWSADTLPRLVQWRMPGAGAHVLGLEPANCRVEGYEAEVREGGPVMLASGASVTHRLELKIETERAMIEE